MEQKLPIVRDAPLIPLLYYEILIAVGEAADLDFAPSNPASSPGSSNHVIAPERLQWELFQPGTEIKTRLPAPEKPLVPHASKLAQLTADMQPTVAMRIIHPPPKVVAPNVCLFVSYSSIAEIKPHVAFHLKAIRSYGFATVLILVTDRELDQVDLGRPPGGHALVLRRNAGFDFGAWADAFRLFPDLWRSQCVLLVNDSIFGPMTSLEPAMNAVLRAPADLVGLTESFQKKQHLQSFFLRLNQRALLSPIVQQFWADVRNFATKEEVIDTYEINLASLFRESGLSTHAIFSLPDFKIVPANPSINLWQVLLERGFPYLKVELFRELINPERWARIKGRFPNRRIVKLIDDYVEENIASHRPA